MNLSKDRNHVGEAASSGSSPPLLQALLNRLNRDSCPRCTSSPLTTADDVFATQAGVRFQASTCLCGPAGLVAWLPVASASIVAQQLPPDPLVNRVRGITNADVADGADALLSEVR